MLPIILASSSPYRRELLAKLAKPFTWQAPHIDETPLSGESPVQLVQRLALEKAQAISSPTPSLVIGSDQVAVCEGHILTKPGNFEKAYQQLSLMSGKKVRFITGLCLLNTQNNTYQLAVDIATLFFRNLNDRLIKDYITLEKPFDCAAGFKFEAHGICLVKRVMAQDPHAIIGLPLIKLIDMLENT